MRSLSSWHKVEEVAELVLEEACHSLRVFLDVVLFGEFVFGVLDELSETDHEAPWVWTAGLESFEEDLRDLLGHLRVAWLRVDREDGPGEVEGVVVGVAELVDDGIEEAESGFLVEVLHDLLECVAWLTVLL